SRLGFAFTSCFAPQLGVGRVFEAVSRVDLVVRTCLYTRVTVVQNSAVLTEDGSATLNSSPRERPTFGGTPPGRQLISREFVLHHQRSRIVQALAEEVVDKGYRDVTVAGIVKRAGVARNTFYASFANKEECFLAASNLAGEEAM